MRKFNLKGTVIQRMRGITREDTKPREESNTVPAVSEMNPAFTSEQGTIRCAWRTDVGRLRKTNQDAVILGCGLAGVADGMGGHKGGEIASAGLRDGLLRELKDKQPDGEMLKEAVKTVNRELWERQQNDTALTGMGTTLTVIWPAPTEMIIGQIGDSRAYLLRNNELMQMTEDHSMVADMVRRGVLTEEQAACHPMRNYITRAAGTEEDVLIDITVAARRRGDRWLICSDGLYSMVSKMDIHRLLETEDLEEAADLLLQASLEGGGKDNVSLLLIQDETDIPEDNDKVEETDASTSVASQETEEVTDQ